jgi:hypothetical protein
MPHGSGYISTGGILGLPRGSDGLILRSRRDGGIIVLDRVVSAPNITTLRSMLRGSALGLAHRISFGEQIANGFHKNFCIGWYGASSS